MTKNNQHSQIALLAEQYGRQVFQTAFRLLGEAPRAEDVTQDVFLKLFTKTSEALDNIKNWPAYLKTMATSASYDLLRRKYLTVEVSEKTELKGSEHNEPVGQLIAHQSTEKFREALSVLPELEAHVFTLRYFEEFTYQEIAEQLSLTTSHVGVLINRSRQKLSLQLSELSETGDNYEQAS